MSTHAKKSKAKATKEGSGVIVTTPGRSQPYAVWWNGNLEVFTGTWEQATALLRGFALHGPDWRPEHEGKP